MLDHLLRVLFKGTGIKRRHYKERIAIFPTVIAFLPPATEVFEGYVFTGVCVSTGGVSVTHLPCPVHAGTHPPPCPMHAGTHIPLADTTRYSQQAGVRIPLERILVYLYFLVPFVDGFLNSVGGEATKTL